MRILLAWIIGSLLIGYLGRNRRAGFWGNVFFSLLLSPLIGAVALLMAGPSGRHKDRARRVIAVRTTAASPPAGISAIASAFLLPWLGLLLVFTIIFAFASYGSLDRGGLSRGFQLSLDMATLGFSGVSGSGATGRTRLYMDLERLGVLLIFGVAIVRVAASMADRRVRHLRTSMDEAISALEASSREQREEITRLRGVIAQASGGRVEASATTAATASH